MGTTQVILSLLALVVVGILGLFFSRSMITIGQRTYQNETLTQVSGLANDILEEIGSRPFDAATKDATPSAASELTAAASFGGDGCDPDSDCDDIDDFHGKTLTRTRGGLDYSIDVSVAYVDEDDPTTYSGSQTFAKQVTVSITNANVYRKGDPDSLISLEMSRVFTYFKTTL